MRALAAALRFVRGRASGAYVRRYVRKRARAGYKLFVVCPGMSAGDPLLDVGRGRAAGLAGHPWGADRRTRRTAVTGTWGGALTG